MFFSLLTIVLGGIAADLWNEIQYGVIFMLIWKMRIFFAEPDFSSFCPELFVLMVYE